MTHNGFVLIIGLVSCLLSFMIVGSVVPAISQEPSVEPLTHAHVGKRDPLHEAVRRGEVEDVYGLISGEVDVDRPDALGRTPLHYAARLGYVDIVKALLAAGASVDPRDRDGFTPLIRAVYGGHFEIAELLFATGANPDARETLSSKL